MLRGIRRACSSLRFLGAAFLVGLLPALLGCPKQGVRPDFTPPPPADPIALSGGKIKHFTPRPELPRAPSDQTLLEACKHIDTGSDRARSGYVVLHSRSGRHVLSALVSGETVLLLVGDVIRQIEMTFQAPRQGVHILFSNTAAPVRLACGEKAAMVGAKPVTLRTPVVCVDEDRQAVMVLPDLLAVLTARAAVAETPGAVTAEVVYVHPAAAPLP